MMINTNTDIKGEFGLKEISETKPDLLPTVRSVSSDKSKVS
jgi:hypothetical protein